MRTILAAALASILGIAIATGEESPKLKVATVRLDRIGNSGLNYETVQLLPLDKETLEAYKKINAEIQALQKEIVNVEDDLKLADLGRKSEFLNRKLNMIRQQSMGHRQPRDIQLHFRDFVVAQYKGKFQLILQDNYAMTGRPDQFLWKGNADFTDITDEAIDKFKERLERVTGEKSGDDGKEPAEDKESPKFKVATVQVDRIMNSGVNYDKLRILSADKATLEAIKKINDEIRAIQKEIVDVEDPGKLDEFGRKLNFLYSKSSLLMPRNVGNPMQDVQAMVRRFAIDKFKDQFSLLLQQNMQDSRSADRVLWKGNVEFVDITDDVAEKFKAYLDQIPDQSNRVHVGNMMHNPTVPLIKKDARPPEAKDVPKAKEATKAKND